jgi:hypothetical protein
MNNFQATAEYDSPWKEALDLYFEQFIAFFFLKLTQTLIGTKAMNFWTKNFSKSSVMRN